MIIEINKECFISVDVEICEGRSEIFWDEDNFGLAEFFIAFTLKMDISRNSDSEPNKIEILVDL